jgi:glycosyltransferase involved in cell wall biosynthesis
LKLGLIAARYPPEFEGGSERVVRALARGLAARGHSLKLVVGTDRPAKDSGTARERVDGIEVLRLGLFPAEPFDLELHRPRVEALVAEEFADRELVHLHHWSSLSQRLVRSTPLRPVIVTLHDLFATCPRFFRDSPSGLVCPPRGVFDTCARCIEREAAPATPAQLERRLADRALDFEREIGAAARWIVPSRSQAERIASLLTLDPEKRVVIAPGLTRPLPRVPRPARGRGFLRLCTSAICARRKRTFDLVEALSLLPAEAAELTLAGRALAPGLEARVEALRGHARVRLLGPYDAAGLAQAARDADLALFPSRAHESYGLVLDEAHALGLPAWSSDRGALSERLVAGERCLPARDPAAWARALTELARDPQSLREVAGRVAELRVPGVDECVSAHEQLYASTLGERAA